MKHEVGSTSFSCKGGLNPNRKLQLIYILFLLSASSLLCGFTELLVLIWSIHANKKYIILGNLIIGPIFSLTVAFYLLITYFLFNLAAMQGPELH